MRKYEKPCECAGTHGSLRSCRTRFESSAGYCLIWEDEAPAEFLTAIEKAGSAGASPSQDSGPRSVVDRTRPCEGRRPGPNPGEDTFRHQMTIRRRSQTERRSPAKRLQVGSTPTGVSLEVCSGGVGCPAAQAVPRSVRNGIADWLLAFLIWVLAAVTIPVSLGHHQTDHRAVAGSTPVPSGTWTWSTRQRAFTTSAVER